MHSLIPDHQSWECIIHQQIFIGILDHKKNFVQKNYTKFYNTKILQRESFQVYNMYVYVCACVLRGGLYVYVYVHPTWWLCVCTHI